MKQIVPYILVSLCLLTHLSILPAQTNKTKSPAQKIPNKYSTNAIRAKNESYTFQISRDLSRIDHVKINLKVGGEIIDVVDRKEQREKMSVSCNLDYDEKTLEIPANNQDIYRSVRFYNQADADITAGDKQFKPVLRPQQKLILNEITPQSTVLYCPVGALNREELDLIDLQGNSLLLNSLLPEKSVMVGDSWKLSEKLLGKLLDLDEVGQTDVQSTLKEVTDKVARFEMSGKVAGAIDGVASEIEIQARYRFDFRLKRVDWLGILVKEKRGSSPISDGIEASAQLSVTITPSDATEHFSESDLKDLPKQSSPELLKLCHFSKDGGWQLA
jgi:hypothetical protein